MAKQTLTGYTSASQVKERLDKVADLELQVGKVYDEVELVGVGTSSSVYDDWKVGDIMYNTNEKKLKKCTSVADDGTPTLSDEVFDNDTYYINGSDVYKYNGTELVTTTKTIATKVNDLEQEVNEHYEYEEIQVTATGKYYAGTAGGKATVGATYTSVENYGEYASSKCIKQKVYAGETYKIKNVGLTAYVCSYVLYETVSGGYKVVACDDAANHYNVPLILNIEKDGVLLVNLNNWETTYPDSGLWRMTHIEGVLSRMENIESTVNRLDVLDSLKGKTIVCFGDSITEYKDADGKGYVDYLAQLTGANVINGGIGGSVMLCRQITTILKITSGATTDGKFTIHYNNSAWGTRDREATITSGMSATEIATAITNICNSIWSYSASNLGDGKVMLVLEYARCNSWDVIVENTCGCTYELQEKHNLNSIDDMPETSSKEKKCLSNIDIPNMINSFCRGDWTEARKAAKWLQDNKGGNDVNTIDRLSAINIDDVDMITIFGGTNNYQSTEQFGEPSDIDIETICGRLAGSIKQILTANHKCKIVVFTPIVRYFKQPQSDWDDTYFSDYGSDMIMYTTAGTYKASDGTTKSAIVGQKISRAGNTPLTGDWEYLCTLPTIVNKEIATAKYWHIPSVDLYWSLGWNRWNYSHYFSGTDGTHPTYGFKALADKMYETIRNVMVGS